VVGLAFGLAASSARVTGFVGVVGLVVATTCLTV
jgi:hypothetical protein